MIRAQAMVAWLATAMLLAMSIQAHAGDLFNHFRHITTEAGQEVRISAHGRVNRHCMPAGAALIRVTTAPQHGTIVTRPGTHIIKQSVGGANCNGREVPSTDVIYIPAADFHGLDRMEYTVEYPNEALTNAIEVTVR